ncbi:hypothetical protein [Bradyrhizobium sp. LeoA1S1]
MAATKTKRCRVCQHREHAAIDLALAHGVSVRALGQRYGLSKDSVYNHAKAHLPAQLRAKLLTGAELPIDPGQLREKEGQSLLAHLVGLRGRLFNSLGVAEDAGDGVMLSRIAGQLHQNLELTGKLVGSLSTGSTSVTNVLVMPQYVDLRVSLVNALRPFPEAARAVAGVLHRLESKAAADIEATPLELAQ